MFRVEPLTKIGDRGPRKEFRSSEQSEQIALFEWCALMVDQYPELVLLFSIPNGGSRHMLEAINLKKMGVKAGVPDVCLPVARYPHHGLFIEMKAPHLKPKQKGKGGVSPDQSRWIENLRGQKFQAIVCYGFEEAVKAILFYLNREGEFF